MKITLISPYPDVMSLGIRMLSGHVRRGGHKTNLVFMIVKHGNKLVHGIDRYSDETLDELVPLCEDSDIIGITLMSNYLDNAIQITQKLKSRFDKPIIWGGVHPTILPERCLEYADMVCVGDGEDALLELLDKMDAGEDYYGTKNFLFRKNGSVVKNELRPLPKHLDGYTMPDYMPDDQYALYENRLSKLSPELLKTIMEDGLFSRKSGYVPYMTMTSRGCPYQCTYCLNSYFTKMQGVASNVRWRSVGHVINELEWIKNNLPHVGMIWFSDDLFFARKISDLKDFCKSYKEKIGFPFFALASPTMLTEEKMELVVDSGLVGISMGVEAGSEKMQKVFNRQQMSTQRILKAMKIINKYKDKIQEPNYDFIINGPYETTEDQMASLRMIAQIPKPFRVIPWSMTLYPGTELHTMALRDGIIKDDGVVSFFKGYNDTYLQAVFFLAKKGKLPSWILRFLISRPMVALLQNDWTKPIFKYLDIVSRKILQRLRPRDIDV